MVGSKRFIRNGLAISALGHAGFLVIGLVFFMRASSQEGVLPDAMPVEIVTLKDIPRLSGTPSAARTSGTESTAKSQTDTAAGEPLPTVPSPPQPNDQRQAQRATPPQPRTAPPQPQPDATAPAAEETLDAPETATTLAQLALLGGRLGGGFAAPPVDSPLVGYDFTMEFRERVSSCAALPPGIDRTEKISITVRLFLNRDGTLAAPPQLREANPSAKQQALMQSFVAGLQKCQPYTMLPADKYKQWKLLDLVVYPLNSFGG